MISACINQFKKDIALLLETKAFSVIDISQQSPLYTNDRNPAEHLGDYSQYIELSYYVKALQREQLSFKDFGVSQEEQDTIEIFLKTLDIGKNPSKNLKKISLKLESLKKARDFENSYHELQAMGLTR